MFEDKFIARDVSDLMLDIGEKLNASLAQVQKGSSAAEFEAYRAVAGQLMGKMLFEVMNPIYSRHPELKPPGLE